MLPFLKVNDISIGILTAQAVVRSWISGKAFMRKERYV
jgi:hypothetical protein